MLFGVGGAAIVTGIILFFVGEDEEERDGILLKRYHVWIARCDQHRSLQPPRFAVPALP